VWDVWSHLCPEDSERESVNKPYKLNKRVNETVLLCLMNESLPFFHEIFQKCRLNHRWQKRLRKKTNRRLKRERHEEDKNF